MDPASAETQAHPDVDFHHPYTPYDVQLDFMKAAYNVLESGTGQIGILESPTGTGKSLSLICASITWLRTFKQREFGASLQIDPKQAEGEPDWIIEQMLQRKRKELVVRWEEREARLDNIRQRERRMEERGNKRRRLEGPASRSKRGQDDEEAEFLLNDWDEGGETQASDELDPFAGLSRETRALLQKVDMGSANDSSTEEDAGATENEIKVSSLDGMAAKPGLNLMPDLLRISDPLATQPIYCRIASAQLPLLLTRRPDFSPNSRWIFGEGGRETCPAIIPPEALHQPIRRKARFPSSHQRQVQRAPETQGERQVPILAQRKESHADTPISRRGTSIAPGY